MTYCCAKFAKEAGDQFEQDKDGIWNVNGCCGGGCYVLVEMRFCPFCGTKLVTPVQD